MPPADELEAMSESEFAMAPDYADTPSLDEAVNLGNGVFLSLRLGR